MTTLNIESSPTSSFNQQQFHQMLNNFIKPPTHDQISMTKIIGSSKDRTQANLFNFNICKAKNQIDAIAQQTVGKYKSIRQNQLMEEIQQLREENSTMQRHFLQISGKYQQKREQLNKLMQQFYDLTAKYELLSEQYFSIQQKYEKKEQSIIKLHKNQTKQQANNFEKLVLQYQIKLKESLSQKRYVSQLLQKTQAQYEKIKQILQMQKMRRKQKQSQLREKNDSILKQLTKQKLQINNLRAQISEKNILLIKKDEQVSCLEKTLREMNERVNRIRKQSTKQIMKERSMTKKAIEGLEMTRKYSQIELSKSRKKQKQYLNQQKQLIGKMKQLSKQQNSVMETTQKWQRKSSIRSLNTTLKLSKPDRQASSPFISNFVGEEQNCNELSPIHETGADKADSVAEKEKEGRKGRESKRKYKIEIGNNVGVESYGRGTPCFEFEKGLIFKAKR